MLIMSTATKMDWSGWRLGLIKAFISGGSGAAYAGFGTMVFDPATFNVHSWNVFLLMGFVFLFQGVTRTLEYLHDHPIADPVQLQQALADAADSTKHAAEAISTAQAAAPPAEK